MFEIRYAYGCNTGKIRENNEDNFWCQGDMLPEENAGQSEIRSNVCKDKDLPVLAVFDGMGGESSGEIAAFLAARTLGERCTKHNFEKRWRPEQFLRRACAQMNRSICDYGSQNRIHSMGSTLAMLAFGKHAVYSCNLGDSRVYRLRDGEMQRLSRDHVIGSGRYGKAPLTQYLGIPEEQMALEPSIEKVSYQNLDRYLVCSDGITDMLKEQEIAGILGQGMQPETIAGELLGLAMDRGGRDNATIIVCEIREISGKE